jgi:cytidine deaminase
LGESDSGKPWNGVERRSSTRDRRASERRGPGERRSQAPLVDVPGERRAVPDRRAGDRRTGQDRRNEAAWLPVPIEETAAANFDQEGVLLAAAVDARTRAHARYSKFMVGAALETADGHIITGCNIENATYGLTLCAERVALVKALSDGQAVFTRIAVVADTDSPTPPCGPCRQLLWEYCGDIDIILGNLNGPMGRYRLSALLPLPFDARLLG